MLSRNLGGTCEAVQHAAAAAADEYKLLLGQANDQQRVRRQRQLMVYKEAATGCGA
jgi:hypothetical protein